MGQYPSGLSGAPGGPGGGNRDGKDKKDEPQKKKWEPPLPTRVGKKKKRGPDAATKLPAVFPTTRCRLKLLKNERIKDYLLLEEEFIQNQERLKPESTREEKNEDELSQVDALRGSPLAVGTLEEIIDDEHAIISTASGPEYYVSILSIVDKDLLEPGGTVLLHHKNQAVVGVMKLDKAPTETYADIGGLERICGTPLTHPELYEEMGIKPPKGVILKAVANQTSATFLRVVGSELIQKYLGDGPKLVRELFRVAEEHAPSIVFIDEIDAIGTKRYIEFPLPDVKTKRHIFRLVAPIIVIGVINQPLFRLHTSRMSLAEDVDLEEYVMAKDDLSGADIKAICTEAGLMALRERRMRVNKADFTTAREKVLYQKNEGTPEGLYL
ncbi:P-loop containing nucleoside triphosphate hydrolase protein [Russula vinacea]|nr:P-loop containing nucleoside triphosphate hydrolase protein [Russula vinacea]